MGVKCHAIPQKIADDCILGGQKDSLIQQSVIETFPIKAVSLTVGHPVLCHVLFPGPNRSILGLRPKYVFPRAAGL